MTALLPRFYQKTSARRVRFALYAAGFPAAIILDRYTPLGVDDWLIELMLVCIASVWGQAREIMLVATIGSATILVGLWSSPAVFVPLWMAALNRVAAIFVIWVIFDLARLRLAAEEARQQAAAQLKILRGLLPICSACKAIRNPAGEWQRLETYLAANSEARLTHSLCPPCAQTYMDDLNRAMQDS